MQNAITWVSFDKHNYCVVSNRLVAFTSGV